MLRKVALLVVVSCGLLACASPGGRQATSSPSSAPVEGLPSISANAELTDLLKSQPEISDYSSATDLLRQTLVSEQDAGSPEAALIGEPDPMLDMFLLNQDLAFAAGIEAAGVDVLHGDHPSFDRLLGAYGDKELIVDQSYTPDPTSNGETSREAKGEIKSEAQDGTIYLHGEYSGDSTTTSSAYGGNHTAAVVQDGSLGICPDASGFVRGQISISAKESFTVTVPRPGKVELDLKGQAQILGRNGDDANLIDYNLLNIDFKGTVSSTAHNRTFGYSWQNGAVTGIQPELDTSISPSTIAGQVSTKEPHFTGPVMTFQLFLIHMAASTMLKQAEGAWKNGYCVKVVLRADTKKQLSPGDHEPIEVEVHQRKDDAKLNVPVSGDPDGSGAVVPDKATSSATMTLVAGTKPTSGYHVVVETTSKRGKDHALVAWGSDLGSYDINGTEKEVCGVLGSDGWTFAGHVVPDQSSPGMVVGAGSYSGSMIVVNPTVHTESVSGKVLIWGQATGDSLYFLGTLKEFPLKPFAGRVSLKGGHYTGTEHGDFGPIPSYDKGGNRIYCDRFWDENVVRTK